MVLGKTVYVISGKRQVDISEGKTEEIFMWMRERLKLRLSKIFGKPIRLFSSSFFNLEN